MKHYKVTVKTVSETEPGAFAGLRRYDAEAWFEDADELPDPELMHLYGANALEVYVVHGSGDLDRFFDNSDGIVEYKNM